MDQQTQTQTVTDILVYVPQALDLNKNSVARATADGQVILDTIEAEGMNAELYEQAQLVLKKIAVTYTKCNDRRMPFFREVEKFRSQFTELEKQIDVKVKGSIAEKIQARLDEHVAELARMQKEYEAEEKRKLAKAQEAIAITNDLQSQLSSFVSLHIEKGKKYFTTIFETITLETMAKDIANLSTSPRDITNDQLLAYNPPVTSIYHTEQEITEFISQAIKGKLPEINNRVYSELKAFKAELLDKVPGKKNELEAAEKARLEKEAADKAALHAKTVQAKADALIAQQKAEQQQQQLAEQTAARQKADQERIAQEKADADLKASQAAEAAKAAQQTQTLFDHQVNSIAASAEMPEVKEGYEIEILNPAGYLPVVAFFFEKEGMQKLPEDLKKKTLGQMVTFAEKWALKNEEKISSPYIIYKPTFKAKAKKL